MEQNAETADPTTRHQFTTHEVTQANDVIGQRCAGLELRPRRLDAPFTYREDLIDVGRILATRVHCSMEFEMHLEPLRDLMLVAMVRGRAEVRDGREEARTGPGGVVLQRTGRPLVNFGWHLDLYSISLDPRTVTEAAVERTGIDPADFRFEAMTPMTSELGQFWYDTATHLYGLLSGPPEPLRSPLVIRSAIDLAASAALATFPNSAMTFSHPDASPVPVGPVRRAVSFIETHAAEALTTTQIADAARVTPRALQAAFRRHLNTTPTAYLRRTRIDRAHQDLLAADPTRGDTVAATAHRWGYLHADRFAADYRATYGRSPSDTLHS
ncbi:AraC family transcriptional regulator [Micromonospora sp. NPDC049275]|uniref:helix-turn-helix transcriptional regulator n=1 Tax=Micromonospora sp. NPDC049275 TaxID=3364268 RepID=UPI0037202015